MSAITHAEARSYLHKGESGLNSSDRIALNAHLADCAECRTYAETLAILEPTLTRALRARWDTLRPGAASTISIHTQFRRKKMQRRIFSLAGVAGAGAVIVLLALVGPALILPYLPASQPAAETIHPAASSAITGGGGGLIAFESTRDGNGEIYVMKIDGSGLTNLTNFPPNDTAPAWSPDGKRIAFLSDRSGKPEVYVMEADGSSMTRLTDDPEADYVPPIVWSPDGTQLAVTVAWTSPVNGKQTHVYLIPLVGGRQPRALTWEEGRGTDIADSRPAWSPDGKRLAFISRTMSHDILMVSLLDRALPDMVSKHWTTNLGELTGDVAAFDWSPDGELAYILLGPKDDGSYIAMLNLIRPGEESADAARTILELPVTGLPLLSNLSWSPDGTRLLFTQADEQGVEQLYLVYNDGSALTRITHSPESVVSPRWSPDGQWIIFEQAGVLSALNVRDAFRSPEKLVTIPLANSSGADSNPQWQPAPTLMAAGSTEPPAGVCSREAIEHCTVSEAEALLGIDIITPQTLPEGYTFDHINYDDLRKRVTLYYTRDNDKLIIGQQPVPAGTDFDMTAFCLPQNASTQGFGWTTPAGMAFCIAGNLSQAEFTTLEADLMAQLPAPPAASSTP